MRRFIAAIFIASGLLIACSANDPEEGGVQIIHADGTIGPIMERYIDRALDDAEASNARAAVIELDTPGGLNSSMRAIVRRIEQAEVPVIVYVSPIGGRAASAGTFITMSAHIAAMAPNTSIGAASAVNSDGGDIGGTMGRKVENDAVAFIRGIAILRGRNADWAEDAVRNAVAVNQSEAVELGVVDYVANDIDDLLRQAEGRTIELRPGEPFVIGSLLDAPRSEVSMTAWERVLDFVADPTIASLLLSIGFLLIVFELAIPGIGVSGIAGVSAIALGFLGFGVLPVDTVGLVLIGFGLALIGVEIFFTSGIFGIAGVVVVALGAFIAFRDTPSDLRPPWWLGVGFGAALLIFFVGMNYITARLRKNEAKATGSRYIGQFAIATTDLGPHGNVRIQGEKWNAQLLGTDRAAAGEKLRVVGADRTILHVRRDEPKTPAVQ